MINADVVEYYKNLLILQYRNKPKATSTIAVLVNVNMLYELLSQINTGLDIHNINASQKIIALMLGVGNFANLITVDRLVFGYRTYDNALNNIVGYITYDDFVTEAVFLTYSSSREQDYELNNEELRVANMLAIFRNGLTTTLQELDDFFLDNFEDSVFVDEVGNMNLIYTIPESAKQIFGILLQKNMIPKPTGVSVNFSYA